MKKTILIVLLLYNFAMAQVTASRVAGDTVFIKVKGLSTEIPLVVGKKNVDSLFLNQARFKDNVSMDSTTIFNDGIKLGAGDTKFYPLDSSEVGGLASDSLRNYIQPGSTVNDMLLWGGSTWIKKTLADVKDTLGIYNVTPSQYGVIGDSAINDYTNFQAMLNGVTNGGTIYLPNGKYRIATGLSVTDKTFSIEGQSVDSVFIYPASGITWLTMAGSLSLTTTTLADSTIPNSNKLIVASSSGFSAGDMIQISSTASWYYDAAYSKGEIHIIDRVGTDTLYTLGKIWDSYDPNAETVTITKINYISPQFKNLSIVYSGSNSNTTGMSLEYCKGTTLDNVKIKGAGSNSLSIAQSINTEVKNSEFSYANNSGLGYGVKIKSSYNTNITHNEFHANRTDIDITTDGTIPSRIVIATDNYADGNGVAHDGTDLYDISGGNSFFGTHGSAEAILVSNNFIYNKYQAFRMRGANVKMLGNNAGGKMYEYLQINSGTNFYFENNTYDPVYVTRANLSNPIDARSLGLFRVISINSTANNDSASTWMFKGNTINGLRETFLEVERDLDNLHITNNNIIYNRDVRDTSFRAPYRMVWDNIGSQSSFRTITNASVTNNHITTINGSFYHDLNIKWISSQINYDLTNDGLFTYWKGGLDITDSLKVGGSDDNSWLKDIDVNSDSGVIELGQYQLIVRSDSVAYLRATPSWCGYTLVPANTDSINIASNASTDPLTDDFSFSTWVVISATDASNRYLFNSPAGTVDRLYFRYNGSTGVATAQLSDGTDDFIISSVDISGYVNNTDKHLFVVTFDRDGQALMYLDGQFIRDASNVSVGSVSLGGVRIGGRAGAAFWDGEIHTLRFWDRLLTDTEVRELYNRGEPLLKLTPGLQVNNVLDLNGLGATTATWFDYSSSNADGTNLGGDMICSEGKNN